MNPQKREDLLWCGLTLTLVILVKGLMRGLMPPLSGDMGRDLYGSWMILQGKTPCRDFWWQYGPLMPLYYAFWFLLGGVHLISFQMGFDGIYVAMAFIAFWTLRLFVSPPVAFLTALAYLSFDYTWTFNHVGAIPLLLSGIFSLWKFLLTSRIRWCYLGTLAFVGMALVKISTGLPFFLAFLLCLLFFNLIFHGRGWKHWLFFPLLFGLLVGGAYLFMYRGLPSSWIDQCLTLTPAYGTRDPFGDNVKHLVMLFLFWQPRRLIWTVGYLVLALLALQFFRKQKLSGRERQMKMAAAGSLVLFFLVSLADFLMLGANPRLRVTFWSHPILILLMGLLGGWALSLLSKPSRVFVYLLVFLWVMGIPLGVIGDPSFLTVSDVFAWRTPERYLDFPHGRAYYGGGPQDLKTAQTLKQVTHYIRENTGPNEKILSVPYEPIFCFLAGRRHATWQLMLSEDHWGPEPYEDEIIRTLERERVRYVVLNNSGSFGAKSYQKVGRYVFQNYEEIETFGSWQDSSPDSLGVKILRRKSEKEP